MDESLNRGSSGLLLFAGAASPRADPLEGLALEQLLHHLRLVIRKRKRRRGHITRVRHARGSVTRCRDGSSHDEQGCDPHDH